MSQERRNQLVDDIVEAQPRLVDFVRTRSGDLIAGSWDLLSYSFQSGFELMWDHAHAQTSGVLTRPLLSLWRQSVELALKSAITEISGGLDRKLGHDLQLLFAELLKTRAALGHDDDDDLARNVTAMIGLVQSLDPFADRFRYPESRNGQPFGGIEVDLDPLFQAHWIIVTWCEGAAIEAQEARGLA
jgi:hypothetical protein